MRASLVLAALLAGCCTIPPEHLAADRALHDAVAPEYRIYVQEDQALDQEQEDRRLRTLAEWERNLAAQEAE